MNARTRVVLMPRGLAQGPHKGPRAVALRRPETLGSAQDVAMVGERQGHMTSRDLGSLPPCRCPAAQGRIRGRRESPRGGAWRRVDAPCAGTTPWHRPGPAPGPERVRSDGIAGRASKPYRPRMDAWAAYGAPSGTGLRLGPYKARPASVLSLAAPSLRFSRVPPRRSQGWSAPWRALRRSGTTSTPSARRRCRSPRSPRASTGCGPTGCASMPR